MTADPHTITDTELHDIIASARLDLELFVITDFDDVQAILHVALDHTHEPTRDQLNDIALWSVENGTHLLLTIDATSGLRPASASLRVTETFVHPDDNAPASEGLRHVLNELLAHHHALNTALDQHRNQSPAPQQADIDRLEALAESLALPSELLDVDIHDVFSRQASGINNSGLEGQIAALLTHLGPEGTEQLIRAAAADTKDPN
ncbi:hypothetical protein OG225_43245 (plasmid) [Nocardia sp. NBC_01377]|uniref:hypothetical protein n=1 Tax=Nocardia sp. NBC_01377 TaxID=2903595 RepID=UPI002F90A040